jgi:hypothetical protein
MKDSRDEIPETHSRIQFNYRRNEDILEELNVHTAKKELVQYEQKWLNHQ